MEKDRLERLFVIGGSSGSLSVLLSVFPQLQPLHDAAIIIVLHRKNSWDSTLPAIFAIRSSLHIKEAEEKEIIKSGCIYIAPADYHLLIENDGSFSLDVSEKVNFSRPSIDVCMETVAEAYQKKAVGILLSGANEDGVNGLLKIKHCGGFTIAQQPSTADVDYMPRKAIEKGAVDIALTPDEIADFINKK